MNLAKLMSRAPPHGRHVAAASLTTMMSQASPSWPHPVSDQVASSSKLAAARPPGVPPGWEVSSTVHVEELRRILQLCTTFQASAGARGRVASSQLQPLLELALKPAHEPEQLPLWTTQLLDQLAAEELASDELRLGLDGASFVSKDRPVGVGKIVKFWFDHVWPIVSERLLPAHHPHDAQMLHRTGRTQKKPGGER